MVARVALVLAATFGIGIAVSAQQTAPQAPIHRPGPGIQNPVVIRTVQPRYTRDAMQARLAGVVTVEAVVQADGSVGDVKVLKSLDSVLGLDDEAISAAKQWLFRPGVLAASGQPVPVAVTIIFEFRLEPDSSVQRELTAVDLVAGDDFYDGTYSLQQPQLVRPAVLRATHPKYTSEAMRAKIQGTVEVEAVIGADGRVLRARVVRSLDQQFGLDDNALEATRAFVFDPARLNGQPVPVVVKLTQEFRIH
jgi:TonB family protein